MAISGIVGKVRGALSRRSSTSSSSSSDMAPSPPGTPGPNQEAREWHAKLAESLKTSIDNSAKPAAPDAETGTGM
jgi:hypothetical protein